MEKGESEARRAKTDKEISNNIDDIWIQKKRENTQRHTQAIQMLVKHPPNSFLSAHRETSLLLDLYNLMRVMATDIATSQIANISRCIYIAVDYVLYNKEKCARGTVQRHIRYWHFHMDLCHEPFQTVYQYSERLLLLLLLIFLLLLLLFVFAQIDA